MNYKKLYILLMKSGFKEKPPREEIYTEEHHKKPKCMGGKNEKQNYVYLTARKHFMAHKLLIKIYPDNRNLKFALHRMVFGNQSKMLNLNSRDYELARRMLSEARTGYKHTPESCDKIKRNHADCSGKRNSRAKKWEVIDPEGKVYLLHGNVKEFCEEYNISYRSFRVQQGRGVIKSSNRTRWLRRDLTGWEIKQL